jgi:hypothetical protein
VPRFALPDKLRTRTVARVVPSQLVKGKRAMRTASSWVVSVIDDALPKFGTMATALIVFFGILLLVFFVAGYASGWIARPADHRDPPRTRRTCS